jgi:hypothetical protein
MQGTKAPYSLSQFRWTKHQLLAEAFGHIATSGASALCRLTRLKAPKNLYIAQNQAGGAGVVDAGMDWN